MVPHVVANSHLWKIITKLTILQDIRSKEGIALVAPDVLKHYEMY